ncbi:hypothetical protein GGR57DRAFT_74222 [Xylariaceae sp. FL1272]|nr:hypothetical protein GGR57DRAFT_74222 [Xylariaceae sp. FL1272]
MAPTLQLRNLGGTDPDDDDENSTNPFTYILIPIIIIGALVALTTCYRLRRRRVTVHTVDTHFAEPDGRRRTVIHGPNGVVIVSEEGQTGGRARRAGRRLGLGVGSREEGLNELGEAPPAYAAEGPKPPGADEQVELQTYSQAAPEAGMSLSPPGYATDYEQRATETETGSSSRLGGTSASEQPTTATSATMRSESPVNGPTAPPRAHLPPS